MIRVELTTGEAIRMMTLALADRERWRAQLRDLLARGMDPDSLEAGVIGAAAAECNAIATKVESAVYPPPRRELSL